MTNRTAKLLFDVLESGQAIRTWCAGRSYADYESDRQFRRAIEREFEIIGEALGRIRQEDEATAAGISDLSRIVAFRNRIIHGYDVIDGATVWGIVVDYLPKLIAEVERLQTR